MGGRIDSFLEKIAGSAQDQDEFMNVRRRKWGYLDSKIWISRCKFQSRMLDFGLYRRPGFTGHVHYGLGAEIRGRWNPLLGLLADFAFYAGVGYMTSMGMGMTTRSSLITQESADRADGLSSSRKRRAGG